MMAELVKKNPGTVEDATAMEDSLTLVVKKQEAALKKLEEKHGSGKSEI